MDRKRLVAAVGISALTGITSSVVAVIGSIAVVVLRGASTRVPGLVDYVQTDRVVSVSTDRDLWVTVLALSVVSLPLSWYAAGRRHPRSAPPVQPPSDPGPLVEGGGGPAGEAPDRGAGGEPAPERAVGPPGRAERSAAGDDRPRRRSSSPANA